MICCACFVLMHRNALKKKRRKERKQSIEWNGSDSEDDGERKR
jgi:uncharacterized OsmC-like protein